MKKKPSSRGRGIALIVSGPSGTGKSTLCSMLLERNPEIKFSVSCTTRSPRPGEEHGRDYYFISEEEFRERVRRGEFLEHAEVHGRRYGTLRSEITGRVAAGEDVLLDIDVQGALQIKRKSALDKELARCAKFIFIGPPDLLELERRLRARGTETSEDIELRLKNARIELDKSQEYDFIVVNNTLEQALVDLEGIVDLLHTSAEKLKEQGFY